MIIRLPSSQAYATQVEKEQTWLPWLAKHLSFEIPTPIEKGKPSSLYPSSWSIYSWIDGDSLASSQKVNKTAIARDLARFLKELRVLPSDSGPTTGKHSFFRGGSLLTYDEQAREAFSKLEKTIDEQRALKICESACSTGWTEASVWVHGDISPGNLLVKDSQLSGIIDFGQLNVGDPACDFAIAWTYFDIESREIFRQDSGIDDATWKRGCAWALWKAAIIASGLMNSNPVEFRQCWNTLEQILKTV